MTGHLSTVYGTITMMRVKEGSLRQIAPLGAQGDEALVSFNIGSEDGIGLSELMVGVPLIPGTMREVSGQGSAAGRILLRACAGLSTRPARLRSLPRQ